ncbi:MAG: hypothetical protein FJW35_05665, partial [Acidobacteria bacterium]|nr:hypothetical protein [Acidobacteriota bacterium]
MADLSQPAAGDTLVFPQIAAGDGYRTQVILINTTGQSQRGQIRLYGDNGSPLPLRAGASEAAQFSYEIAPNGTYRIEFTSSALAAGYALVVPDPGAAAPEGSAVFRFIRNGSVVTEAGVGAGKSTTSARIFVDNAACYTGVALVNRAPQTCSVSFTLIDRDGLALETRMRQLPPNAHLAIFAHELFPGLGDKFTGLMEISTTTPVAPITLKLVINAREDLIYTTLPVADLSRPPAASSLILPQIAFGGEFSTRLVLINTDRSNNSTGRLTFYQSNSSPMSLTFGNQAGSSFSYQLARGGGTQFFPGNAARLASVVFWDSQANRVTREVAVNEGNRIKVPLLVLDEAGTPRDDFVLNYTSLDPEVATVDADGYVTARKKGFSTLTVSSGGVIAIGTIMVAQVQPMAASNTIPVPLGIAQDMAQGVYLAVPQEHAILYVQEPGKAAASYAGTLGAPGYKDDLRSKSLFRNPSFLALNQAQGTMYVSDGANNVIRRVQAGPQGEVETFAG